MSIPSRLSALRVLSKRYRHVSITDVTSTSGLDDIIKRAPDLAFLGMKYIQDETVSTNSRVWVAQELDAAGIYYTGSDNTASFLEHDKQYAKNRVAEKGLATARHQTIRNGTKITPETLKLTFPIFVKPVDGGGGSGIDQLSLTRTYGELVKKLETMNQSKHHSLLESYLSGREFSVGILRRIGTDEFDVMPIEIVSPVNEAGDRYLSRDIKRADTESIKRVKNSELRANVCKLALSSFKALGAQDYGRIDIRLDEYGIPHFLEANLMPSLLEGYGNLPKASYINIGLSYEDLILRIVDLAFERKSNNTDQESAFQATLSLAS